MQRGLKPFNCHVDKKQVRFLLILLCVSVVCLVNGTLVSSAHSQEEQAYNDILPNPIKQENHLELSLIYKKNLVGAIDGYSNYSGTLVSVRQIFDKLGYEYTYDPTEKRIFGKNPGGKWFMIKTLKKEIIIDTNYHDYSDVEVYSADQDIYADISFLSRYFDFDLSVNLNTLELTINSKDELFFSSKIILSTVSDQPEEEDGVEKEETIVVEESKLIPPSELPINQRDSKEGLKEEQKQLSEIGELPEFTVDDSNFLLFELQVGKLVNDELLDIYREKELFFTPLQQLFRATDLPITVNADTGTVTGWFFNAGNTFSLDINKKTATVKGVEYTYPENSVFEYDGEIYVLNQVINQWMPLNIVADFNKQALVLQPQQLLPFQAKKEREKKRELWEQRQARQEKDYPLIEKEYGYTDWPMADFSVNMNYDKSATGEKTFTPDFSTIMSGDAKIMNVKTFATGNEDELTSLRVLGSRKDVDGDLPGGFTNIEIGDTNATDTPLVGGTDSGRGVFLTSAPFNRPSQFGSTVIEGDSLPGWEIELYINDVLTDFQSVGDDGRYKFEDVPILYGNNDVKLVFYGPQGEIREETKDFLVSDSLIPKDSLLYEFSAVEKNNTLFKVGAIDQEEKKFRVSGKMEYGLTDNLTLISTTTHSELDDKSEHTYQTLGVSTSIGQVLANANFAQDLTSGGWASQFIANTRLFDNNIQAKHTIFSHDYISEINENENDKRQNVTTLNVGGSVDVPLISGLGYRVKADHERFISGIHETTVDAKLTTSYRGISYSNSVVGHFDKNDEGSAMTLDGDFSLRGRYEGVLLRANADYGIEPLTELRSVNISGQKKISRELDTTLTINKSFIGDRMVSLSGLLNWDNKTYKLGNRATFNTDGSFSLGANVSFSLFQDPRSSEWNIQSKPVTDSGMLSTVAFLDANYNSILDEGEEIIEEVTFLRSNVRNKSREDGSALISNIPTGAKTAVSVDQASLYDAFLKPAVEGYYVVGRAGVVQQINFPIVETSEIDGIVYYVNDEGKEQTVSGLTLFLLTPDGKKVGEAKTEFDGLFIFAKVLPGEYLVAVSEEEMAMLKVKPEQLARVNVETGGEIYSGYDIVLYSAPPALPVADIEDANEEGISNKVADAEPVKETPWPTTATELEKEDPVVQETPLPQYANIAEGSMADLALKTKLLPDEIAFKPDIYALPESRYSENQLGIYTNRIRKSIEDLEERLEARREIANTYPYPMSKFVVEPSGSATSVQEIYAVPGLMDQDEIKEKYDNYLADARFKWADRLKQIEEVIGLGVPVVGLDSSSGSQARINTGGLPPSARHVDSAQEDIEDRLEAQLPWFEMENVEKINYRKNIFSSYSVPNEQQLQDMLSARNRIQDLLLETDKFMEINYRETSMIYPTHSDISSKKNKAELLIPEEYLKQRKEILLEMEQDQSSTQDRIDEMLDSRSTDSFRDYNMANIENLSNLPTYSSDRHSNGRRAISIITDKLSPITNSASAAINDTFENEEKDFEELMRERMRSIENYLPVIKNTEISY